jgi:branched-chain amino acid transport system substrate-binding protein
MRRGTAVSNAFFGMVAGVSMVVVGCGGTATSNSSPILVGEIAGTTGAYGTTGVAMVNGAQMAIDQLNAQGGVLGRKFTFQWYNDNASATVSSQEFQRLVSAGAVAITGSGDTGPATAAEADRYQIPNIGVVDDGGVTVYPNGPDKAPLPWVWDFGLNTYAWGGKDAQYALKNCSGLAVLHDPASYGEGGDQAIRAAYAAAHKSLALDDAITENWSTGATVGLTTEINNIKRSGANCVVVWLTPQDQATFVQTAHSLGDNFTILGNDETNADNTYASLAGNLADGTVTAELTSELSPSSQLQAFQKAYQDRFHVASTPFAETTYDSVMMLAKAIQTANSTRPADLQKAFNSISNFGGITGSLSFTAQNHTTIGVDQVTVVKYNATAKAWSPVSNR